MKRAVILSSRISLGLCLVSTIGLAFTNIFFLVLRNKIIMMDNVEVFMQTFSIPVAIIYIIFGLFHITAISSIILQLYFFKTDNFLRAFLFFLGIISTLMLFGDFALASDISKEYVFGLPSEFNLLFLSQALHFIFYILMITLICITIKQIKQDKVELVIKDDSIFINAQYIGILSGLSGLSAITIFSLLYLTLYPLKLWALRAGIVVVSLIAALPYTLITFYWIALKAREKIAEWYDEKQYQDLAKSGLVSLLLSIFSLLIIFITQYALGNLGLLNFIWFPLYFFFTLLVFSAATLFFNKKS